MQRKNDALNQNDKLELPGILKKRTALRIGLTVSISVLFFGVAAVFLFFDSEQKLLALFPASSIIIIIFATIHTIAVRRRLKDLYYYTKLCKENEKKLHHLVYYNSLTGLPNRNMIFEEMDKLIKREHGDKFYLVYIDFDDFRRLNEVAGYNVGDEILCQVTRRWNAIKRPQDILGHSSGDEFYLLVPEYMEDDNLIDYIESFRLALKEQVTVAGKEYHVSASFGIAGYPNDGTDVITLVRSSFIAMNAAKSMGKNHIQFFTSEMQQEVARRLQIENGLMYSLKNNELYMEYQPMYNCATLKLRGFEALARWKYPGIGYVSPSQFIPIAEETGVIVDLGKWIMKEVLTKFVDLHRKHQVRTVVSINVSVIQMIEPSFMQMIEEVLNDTGFDGRYLELEITESVLISYPEHISEIIHKLRGMGIRIALDDFGTGYASINYLQLLPINVLKIDRSFIDKIGKDETMNQIIKYIINLAHQLDIEVVAEGVEYKEQLDFLRLSGCDYIQGFLMSRPIQDDRVPNLLLADMENYNYY